MRPGGHGCHGRAGSPGTWSTPPAGRGERRRAWLGSGLPHAVRRESASGGVGVVVDVGLPQVLCLGVDVGLVIVFQSWVIVLMGMSGRHMLPLAAVPEVVHYVRVLVVVNDGVVGVFMVFLVT